MFVSVDKQPNTIVVVRRKYFIKVPRNEIHSSTTFQATNLTEQQIINEHLNVTNQLKDESSYNVLAS